MRSTGFGLLILFFCGSAWQARTRVGPRALRLLARKDIPDPPKQFSDVLESLNLEPKEIADLPSKLDEKRSESLSLSGPLEFAVNLGRGLRVAASETVEGATKKTVDDFQDKLNEVKTKAEGVKNGTLKTIEGVRTTSQKSIGEVKATVDGVTTSVVSKVDAVSSEGKAVAQKVQKLPSDVKVETSKTAETVNQKVAEQLALPGKTIAAAAAVVSSTFDVVGKRQVATVESIRKAPGQAKASAEAAIKGAKQTADSVAAAAAAAAEVAAATPGKVKQGVDASVAAAKATAEEVAAIPGMVKSTVDTSVAVAKATAEEVAAIPGKVKRTVDGVFSFVNGAKGGVASAAERAAKVVTKTVDSEQADSDTTLAPTRKTPTQKPK